jgi:predicted molibdopterin-dependent oxidoreductase YjgC
MTSRFVRLAETSRPPVQFFIDGQPASAMQGDTLLVAMLDTVRSVRTSEFDPGRRAGFCLMGACQDCWVWTEQGERLRACSTEVSAGLRIVTRMEAAWLKHA